MSNPTIVYVTPSERFNSRPYLRGELVSKDGRKVIVSFGTYTRQYNYQRSRGIYTFSSGAYSRESVVEFDAVKAEAAIAEYEKKHANKKESTRVVNEIISKLKSFGYMNEYDLTPEHLSLMQEFEKKLSGKIKLLLTSEIYRPFYPS